MTSRTQFDYLGFDGGGLEEEVSRAYNIRWFKSCFLLVIVEQKKGSWLRNYSTLKKICFSHLLWCYDHKCAIFKAVLFTADK